MEYYIFLRLGQMISKFVSKLVLVGLKALNLFFSFFIFLFKKIFNINEVN